MVNLFETPCTNTDPPPLRRSVMNNTTRHFFKYILITRRHNKYFKTESERLKLKMSSLIAKLKLIIQFQASKDGRCEE